jgi:hypothetical protein
MHTSLKSTRCPCGCGELVSVEVCVHAHQSKNHALPMWVRRVSERGGVLACTSLKNHALPMWVRRVSERGGVRACTPV